MIRLGNVTVEVTDEQTVTTFENGAQLVAHHAEQPGQDKTAQEYGLTVEQMNRTHDLAHSLLAHWLGLPASPTLQAVAEQRRDPNWWIEERAVLALQSFAAAVGVDLVERAKDALK